MMRREIRTGRRGREKANFMGGGKNTSQGKSRRQKERKGKRGRMWGRKQRKRERKIGKNLAGGRELTKSNDGWW